MHGGTCLPRPCTPAAEPSCYVRKVHRVARAALLALNGRKGTALIDLSGLLARPPLVTHASA